MKPAETPEELFCEESFISEQFFTDLRSALDAGVAAETLGFGWRFDSYHCPVGAVDSGEERREYRLLVWKHLFATRLPMLLPEDDS